MINRYRSPIALSPGGDDPKTVFPDHNGNLWALREASGTYSLSARQIGRKRGGKITIRYGFDVSFARRTNQYPTFHIMNDIYGPNGRDIGSDDAIVAKVRPKLMREYEQWRHFYFGREDDKAFVDNAVFWAFEAFNVSPYDVAYRQDVPMDVFKRNMHIGTVEGDDNWLDNLEAQFGYARMIESDHVKALVREEIRAVIRREAHARWPKVQAAFIQAMSDLKVIRPAVLPDFPSGFRSSEDATL